MYFYVVYRLSQFFMILALSLFYTYSIWLAEKFEQTEQLKMSDLADNFPWEMTIYLVGLIFVSIALVLNVFGLTSILEKLNIAIKELSKPLKEELEKKGLKDKKSEIF